MQNPQELEKEFLELVYLNLGIVRKIVCLYADQPSDKADLEQEILLQLWKSYPTFKGLSKFETWMYRVSLNTAMLHIKKVKKPIQIFKVLIENQPILNYEENEYYDENRRIMGTCINLLNNIEKAILHLYFDKHNYQEIGNILGISSKNVNVRMHRIKEKLKKHIQISLLEES